MAGALLVTPLALFCLASTTASYSHGSLASLLAPELETSLQYLRFNGENPGGDLGTAAIPEVREPTTFESLWMAVTPDITTHIDSTIDDVLFTTVEEDSASRTDSTDSHLVTTAAQSTSYDTPWTTVTDSEHVTEIFGTWSAWSACSSPCDGGLQTRNYSFISSYRAINMAMDAEIPEESEDDHSSSRLCNTNFCKVDVTEESYGVYIDIRTTLSTEQYVRLRDQIRDAVGEEVIRYCNSSSNNFAICCANQPLRVPLAKSQALLDSIVVKRATTPKNDSAMMSLFLVLKANATSAICSVSSAVTTVHSAVRRSAEEHYMTPTVLSRLLESGSLTQTITNTIEVYFPNVTAQIISSRLGASIAPVSEPQASNATSSTPTLCDALMEVSQRTHQCVYSAGFFVAISSPSFVLLIVLLTILSACKLRKRQFLKCFRRGRGNSSNGGRGRTPPDSKDQTDSGQQRRYVQLELGSRSLDDVAAAASAAAAAATAAAATAAAAAAAASAAAAAHSTIKQDSLTETRGSSDVDDLYVNTATFRSGSQSLKPAVAAVVSDVRQPWQQPPSPPLPKSECGTGESAVHLPLDQHNNNPVNSQKKIDRSAAQLLATGLASNNRPTAQVPGERRLIHGNSADIAMDGPRPLPSAPTAQPVKAEKACTVRMSQADSEYASIADEEPECCSSVQEDDGNQYVLMG